jgi:RNase P/RNase MRP subunit p30
MRFYVDLHLCPQSDNHANVREMVEKASELGYKATGIPISSKITQKETEELKEICSSVGVDLVTRIDLAPKTPGELLKNLRSLRTKAEIIAIKCYSKQVARQAAKDRRVDLISFPLISPKKRFFDFAEAELASGANASLEIDMAPLLKLQGFERSILLSSLRREIQVANKAHVSIVLSSGADEPIFLRSAEDYCSLTYLFGMDQHNARLAFLETPKTIVEQNRRKLSSNFLAPGVFIVRRGKGCPDI